MSVQYKQFTIKKQLQTPNGSAELSEQWCEVRAPGTYLLEDSGGPDELKAQLAMYHKKKFDEDVRETFEDFAEWIVLH